MKENNIKTLSQQTSELLNAGRYKDTITLLRRRVSENPISGALGRLNRAEETYKYLLRYFREGVEDPGRETMLEEMRDEFLDIASSLDKESLASDSSEMYFSTLRMGRLRPIDINKELQSASEKKAMSDLAQAAGTQSSEITSQLEECDGRLFDAFWVADSIPAETYRKTSEIMSTGAPALSTVSMIIAGTGLGLSRYYTREALMMLCDLTESADYKIAARAMVTLVIALDRWNQRVATDRRVLRRLEALLDNDGMGKKLRSTVITLIKTRDTDKVTRKMQKEVIPGLMQFGPDIIKRMKDTLKESSFADIEGNPEWEELLKNSGLEEKLRELTEMQNDGADVMMSAFSNLKGYPFFRQARNWMLPFSLQHTMLQPLQSIDESGLSEMLEINGMMCDSDKYSFAFSLSNMPEMQRKLMIGQMSGQLEQMKEQMRELENLKSGRELEDEITRYSRDLYRFHKLFPKRGEFADPFSSFIDFGHLPVVGQLFDGEDELAAIAEFYFKRGYYADSCPLLTTLAEKSSATPHVWEKIGFCLEKTGEDEAAAVEAYMKAQLFNPDSKWISRRLGLCYRRMGDYRNAVDYLRQSLPDDGSFDKRMSLMMADTLMDYCKWEEALNELYRVDYETPDDSGVIRRMACCAFRLGDYDKASSWLDAIPQIEKSEEDYRMAGHIRFLQRDYDGAIENYRLTVRPNDKRRLWKSNILSDMDILEKAGGKRSDMLLLLESMAYGLEG